MTQQEVNTAFYAAQVGDNDAFTKLFEAYWDMAYYNCLKRLRNEQDAEDAVQEVFLILYRRISKLKGPEYLAKGIQYYALEVCSGYYNKNKRIPADMITSIEELTEEPPAPKEEFLPEIVLEREELKAEILELVNNLPKRQREVIFNYYFNDFSAKEIATLLKISVNAVGFNLHKARKKLTELVESRIDSKEILMSGAIPVLTKLFQEEMAQVAAPGIGQRIMINLKQKIAVENTAGQIQQNVARASNISSKVTVGVAAAAACACIAIGVNRYSKPDVPPPVAPPPKESIEAVVPIADVSLRSVTVMYYCDTMDDAGYMGEDHDEIVDNQIPGSTFTITDDLRDMSMPEGYKFDSMDSDLGSIVIAEDMNVIKVLYTRIGEPEFRVTVKYYLDTMDDAGYMGAANDEIAGRFTEGSEYMITEALRDKRMPDGYVFNSVDAGSGGITVTAGVNVISVLYTKPVEPPRDDLIVTIKYYRDTMDNAGYMGMGSDEIVGSLTLGDTYSISGALRDRHMPAGYKYSSMDTASGSVMIAESGNVIRVLYTRLSDLFVTVRYYCDTMDDAGYLGVSFDEIVGSLTYGDKYAITNALRDKNVPEGYKFDSMDSTLGGAGVAVSGNEINVLYTKRSDLNVTIRYYQDTMDDAGYMGVGMDEVVGGQTFAEMYTITGALRDKNIPDGYRFDSTDAVYGRVNVAVSGSGINVLYTKRGDLYVTIKYYQDTMDDAGYMGAGFDEVVGEQTFADMYAITNALRDKNIPDGYKFDSMGADSGVIKVASSGNVIKVLYTRIGDLVSARVTRFSDNLLDGSDENLKFNVVITLPDGNALTIDHAERVDDRSKGNKFFVYRTVYGSYTVYVAWDDNCDVTACEIREFVPA